MNLRQFGALLAVLLLAWLPLSALGGSEDMLLLDGTIWTGDPSRPWAEALWIEDCLLYTSDAADE